MELEKNQLEEEKNNKMENDNHNDLLIELESLQNQIQELKESKDKILISSDQEKTSYINERKEIESLYSQVKDQKFELEKQFNSLKQSSQRELSVVTEKAKNDLNQKQNEINKITESLTKSEKVNDSLKKRNRKTRQRAQ